MPGEAVPAGDEKRGRKRPREPPLEGGKEEMVLSAQAEERQDCDHDHDQTDDVDDGIHGGNSSLLKTYPLWSIRRGFDVGGRHRRL